ncbi:MAG: hypothetical protein IJT12_05330 [Paludibacteraceae bacterium]|nr:hypothetical protein [Paludibacteraceae bacterium]
MIQEHELIHIGRILRTHGTSGELQCRMLNTLWEDNDATFLILNVDEIFVPFRVTDWRTKGSEDVLLTLHSVSTEQHAMRFVGCEAYMLRSDLPTDVQEQTDLTTLIGYTLCDVERGELGKITAIDTSTMNTLVQLDNGALLPLHGDFVTEADAQTRKLTIRTPDGLME